jgi:uncharacterized protein (DUF488 family)
MPETEIKIWTIGHSTRSIDDFLQALQSFQIKALVDVRSIPGSRRHPQFGASALAASLAQAAIGYHHFPDLGGRRRARPDSLNTAWRNESFRGYADYMETAAFREAVDKLILLARERRTAIMCAEAVWWRCHRGLISDFLKAKGVEVIHIIDARKSESHPFTSAARIIHGELSYRGLFEKEQRTLDGL